MRLLVVACILFLICEAYHYPPVKDTTLVRTKYGILNGTIELSRQNFKYIAFRGIPYAKPPVGDRRFKEPEAPETWTNIRSAHEHGPKCIQKDILFVRDPPVVGSEDCLYLNVYAPKLFRKTKVPVMVFIHYGGFTVGNGNSDTLGPQYFMDKDVILVTFNYRLGVMGFLSTGDDAAPGNAALKDQVAALKWVKNNIESFGGNPEKVTLFGQSAGGGSSHLHMLSPLSKGLFNGVISQSGSALALWAKPQTALQTKIAQQHAVFVGCDSKAPSQEMIDCLRKIDAKTLVESSDKFKFYSVEPINLYTPVLEKRTKSNPNPFLVEEPLTTIQKGNFQKVPWMLGVVKDEGILRVSPFLRNADLRQTLESNFEQIAPNLLGMGLSVPPDQVDSVFKNVSQRYLGKAALNSNDSKSIQGFIDLYSDRAFTYGSYQSALLHASKGHKSVWFYNFNYRGANTFGDLFALTSQNINFKWGVSHCDELIYLFQSPAYFKTHLSHNDKVMSQIMIQLWTNFAIFGNPTPTRSAKGTVWDPLPNLEGEGTLHNSFLHYLNISGPYKGANPVKLEINNSFMTERMHFWESLPLAENVPNID